jgi:hypothetical protein
VKICAERFLSTVLTQTNAFRHQSVEIFGASPIISEIVEGAAPNDADWMRRLVTNRLIDEDLNDERAFVRGCFGAPLRAAAHGANFFVMIDDLHESAFLKGEIDFIEELKDVYSKANIRFVFSGRRRLLYGASQTGTEKLSGAGVQRVEPLSFADAGFLAENIARQFDVIINEQTRDLTARKFNGNPTFIKFLILAASARKVNLDSFHQVEKIYTDEIFGGAIGKFYDSLLQQISSAATAQKNLIGLIYNALTVAKEKAAIETWQERTGLNDENFYRVMSLLNINEIVRVLEIHVLDGDQI